MHSNDAELSSMEISLRRYLNEKQQEIHAVHEACKLSKTAAYAVAEDAYNELHAFAKSILDSAKKVVDERIALRKNALQEASKKISDIESELSHMRSFIDKIRTGGDNVEREDSECAALMKKINLMRTEADASFDREDDVMPCDVLTLRKTDEFDEHLRARFNSLLRMELHGMVSADFRLRMISAKDVPGWGSFADDSHFIWIDVSVIASVGGTKTMSKVLMREFTVYLEGSDGVVVKHAKFDELVINRDVVFRGKEGFCFKLDMTEAIGHDSILRVYFGCDEIKGSPQMLSFRLNKSFRMDQLPNVVRLLLEDDDTNKVVEGVEENGAPKSDTEATDALWKSLHANVNVTRGVACGDLDESDMRSMGYLDQTNKFNGGGLSAVAEETSAASSEGAPDTATTAGTESQQRDQAPVLSRNRHLDLGPQCSPLRSDQLPLDVASPLTPIPAVLDNGNGVAAETNTRAASGSGHFTPKLASTQINKNLEENLRLLQQQPDYEHEGQGEVQEEVEKALLDSAPGRRIEEFQKNLSGEGKLPRDIANKSVSFHPETTILDLMRNGDSKNGKDLTLKVLMNNSNEYNSTLMQMLEQGQIVEGQVTSVGRTKTRDGEQSLSKNLLQMQQQQPVLIRNNNNVSVCDSSDENDMVDKNSATSKEDMCHDDTKATWQSRGNHEQTLEVSIAPPSPSEQSNWDITGEVKKGKVPEFNLADLKFNLVLIKSFEIHGLPQSIARDPSPSSELTYVTDVENNVILRFKGFQSLGVWDINASFFAPRYVLCLPKDGRVVVLDNKALYVFKRNGKLHRTLFKGEVDGFRGLTYDATYGRLVTTETKNGVSYLTFIDHDSQKDVVMQIPLEPTRGHQKSKVRYLSCNGQNVYTTDVGLGVLYVTNLKTNETKVCKSQVDGSNRLKNAMGVTVDPAGNVLVASAYHGHIELLTEEGEHIRTLKIPKLEVPSGISLDKRSLFVVDAATKNLHSYSVAETEL